MRQGSVKIRAGDIVHIEVYGIKGEKLRSFKLVTTSIGSFTVEDKQIKPEEVGLTPEDVETIRDGFEGHEM